MESRPSLLPEDDPMVDEDKLEELRQFAQEASPEEVDEALGALFDLIAQGLLSRLEAGK